MLAHTIIVYNQYPKPSGHFYPSAYITCFGKPIYTCMYMYELCAL